MFVIETAIARAYRDDDWMRFWPAQFVVAGIPEPDALLGLKQLVQSGHLDAEVFLRCPEGHVAKHGRPEEFTPDLEVTCAHCESLAEAAEGLELQFTISPGWKQHLDELFASPEKKSPESPTSLSP